MEDDMKVPKVEEVKRSISVIWENLQCPICLDLMSSPVSTKCDHQFCRFCILKLLECSRKREVSCPICKAKVTKRSLQESPGFQKLVEGLKNVVQAFEEDTCMQYLNGMSHKPESTGVLNAMPGETQLGKGEASSAGRSQKNITGKSQLEGPDEVIMSSEEAKNAFATLMGLEDSCTFMSDKEDLQNGVNDLPQDLDGNGKPSKKRRPRLSAPEAPDPCLEKPVATDNEKIRIRGKKAHDTCLNQRQGLAKGETIKNKTKGHIDRKGKPVDPDQELVLNKKTTKSLEKVTEWLLNIPQATEGKSDPNLQGSFQNNSENCLSDINSSSCTAKEDQHEEETVNLKISERNQSLEEKVFGVVYQRDRRSTRARRKTCFSPEAREVTQLAASGPVKETQIKDAKKRVTNKLTPADFVKRSFIESERDQPITDPSEKNDIELCTTPEKGAYNVAKVANCTELSKDMDVRLLDTTVLTEDKDKLKESPAIDVPGQRRRRKNRIHLNSDWQEVSGMFLDPSQKLNTQNGKKESSLPQKKPLKSAKPLELVSVAVDVSDSMTNSLKGIPIEAEVQIESYPSSMDQGNQALISCQRSRRLQIFTDEVQGTKKKTISVSTTRNIKADSAGKAVRKVSKPKDGTSNIVKNGCVAFVDVCDIEKENSDVHVNADCECEAKQHSVQDGSPQLVPNTEDPGVAFQRLPVEFLEVSQNSRKDMPNASTEHLILHRNRCDAISTEIEEDRNNSEVDTEQLLKTFKTTKRRSFCLGSPGNTFSDMTLRNSYRLRPEQQNEEDWEDGSNKKKELYSMTYSVDLVQHNADALNLAQENNLVHSNLSPSTFSSSQSHSVLHPKSEEVRLQRSKGELHTMSLFKSEEPGRQPCMVHVDGSPPRKRKNLNSRHYISSEEVGSEPLFPISEEEPQNPDGSNTKKLCPSTVEGANSGDPSEVTQTHSRQLAKDPHSYETNSLVESSATPDDLLSPNIAVSISSNCMVTTRQELKMKEEADPLRLCSQVNLMRKRKRPRRLNSSESEDSGEDSHLPSLADLFGFKASCQLTADESAQLRSENMPVQGQMRCPKEFSGGEASPSTRVVAGCANSCQPPSPGWIPASQSSVDLFGTQEECDSGPGGTELSGQSLQFSSEIISTQQKVAMREELRRLEKMMALVTDALRQKEAPPQSGCAGPTAAGLHNSGPSCDDQSGKTNSSVPQRSPQVAQAVMSTVGSRTSGCSRPSVSPIAAPVATEPAHSYVTERRLFTRDRSSQRNRATGPVALAKHDQTADRVQRTFEEMPAEATVAGADSEQKSYSHRSVQRSATMPTTRSCSPVVLVASGLSAKELSVVKKFAKKTGARVCPQVTPQTTHIVIRTDGDLVCERTLKYFLGIAGRKWVVSFQWIAECFKQRKVLDEAQFEVRGDVATAMNHQGPAKARATDDHELLMRGHEICFQGTFSDMTTGQMEWMVEMCGAKVVKDPLLFTPKCKSKCQLVVVQPGLEGSQADYRALQKKVTVVSRDWLLDSVATYTLQNPDDYGP